MTIIFVYLQSIGNLPFYSSYLPETVEANLKPIVESSPLIFAHCVNGIVPQNKQFNVLLNNCSSIVRPIPEESTTRESNFNFTTTSSYELL